MHLMLALGIARTASADQDDARAGSIRQDLLQMSWPGSGRQIELEAGEFAGGGGDIAPGADAIRRLRAPGRVHRRLQISPCLSRDGDGLVWDEDALDTWMTSTQEIVRGSTMWLKVK
jgi:hypothetical protein